MTTLTGFYRLAGVACLVCLASVAIPASAQLPRAGDGDSKGRVLLRVVAKMDEPRGFGRAVEGVTMFIVTEEGVRIELRTDAAGIATAWLLPKTYRLVTRAPVTWDGQVYSWDLIVRVRAGMSTISLSQVTATKIVALDTRPAGANVAQAKPAVGSEIISAAKRPNSESELPADRRGFWFSLGFGFGSLGCNICKGYLGGLSGAIAAGIPINANVLVGVASTAWAKSENGDNLSLGTLDARVRFYPSATRGLFFSGGAGLGTVNAGLSTAGVARETGFAVIGGIGLDFRVGNNLSLTPFWNGVAVKTSGSNANVSQIGVGLTIR